MSITTDLQNKTRAYQTGQDVNRLPDITLPKQAVGPVAPVVPPEPEEVIDIDLERERPDFIGRDAFGVERNGNEDFRRQASQAGWGQSRFDIRSGYQPGENLEDIRAREESGANKLLRGVTKGVVTAGTTFANTTAGVLVGALRLTPIGTAAAAIAGNVNEGDAGAYLGGRAALNQAVNNPISKWLTGMQTTMEEVLPNYRTEKEQSEEYQRGWANPTHWNANFWADFIKNFGFTAGAMLGGAGWSKVLGKVGATKLSGDLMKGVAVAADGDAAATEALGQTAQAIRAAKIVTPNTSALRANIKSQAKKLLTLPVKQQFTGALISAFGEGSAEGLMAREEFMNDFLPKEQREFQQKYDGLEEELLQDPRYTMPVVVEDELEPQYVLNDDGRAELLRRQNELFELYQERAKYANEQADQLASTTFLLNIPILTVSNAIQFARLFGGGWNSARKTAASVAGKAGKYNAGAPTWLRAVAGTGKVMGAEASEEMLQGTVSSGAKKVAENNLSYFNDLSFDKDSVNSMKDWFVSMSEGGGEYLSDWKNWQEGFMGALTGLLGMPGRGYFRGERGGVFEAINEARENRSAAQEAANKLNRLVNSDDFQNRWRGYVRHLVFNEQMKEAVAKDDQYSYQNASSNQLASDILMFAKAGKLDDLIDLSDRYSNLSQQDIDEIREMLHSENSEETDTMPDSEIKDSVEKQAKLVRSTIKEYGEVYNEMKAIMPMNTPDNLFDEVVLTTMQLNNVENRFLTLLDETMKAITPILASRVDKNQVEFDQKVQLDKLKTEYAEIFSGSLVSVPKSKQRETKEQLDKLKGLVSGNSQLEQKVGDMIKLYEARQKYFDKISNLEKMPVSEFEDKAQNQQKTVAAAEKQAATEEAESFKTLDDVKTEYNREKKRNLADVGAFVNRMRKAKDDNPVVANFVNIYDAFSDLQAVYTKSNGKADALVDDMLNHVFEIARTNADMTDPGNVETFAQYSQRIRDSFDTRKNGASFEDMLNRYRPQMDVLEETYNEAYARVVNAMQQLSGVQASTSGRQQARSVTKATTPNPTAVAQSDAREVSQPASKGPNPAAKKSASIDADGQSATDSDGRTWTVGETMFGYDPSRKNQPIRYTVVGFKSSPNGDVRMIANDGTGDKEFGLVNQTPYLHKELPSQEQPTIKRDEDIRIQDPTPDAIAEDAARLAAPTPTEVQKAETETNNSGERTYYQSGIPEFDVDVAREWREADTVEAKKAAVRKIRPFYDESNPKRAGYKTVWDKLTKTWDAFTNAVKNVKVGDKVKFIANADAGEYNGKPRILMAVEKDGKRYIFNVMRRTGNYAGLNDFLNEFDKQYTEFQKLYPGQEFVFDKESTVWGKRGGIVDYDYSDDYSGEQPITKISGYDENAPIVWINGNGEFETLRGNPNAARTITAWRSITDADRQRSRGNVYYLADDGLGGYIPIRLGIEHFTEKNYMNDNPKFNAIRESLMRIEGIAGHFFGRAKNALTAEDRNQILDEENARLHEEVGELRKMVNLTTGFFGFTYNNQGQPILFYDRNANSSGEASNSETKFQGFWVGENGKNNISKLVEIFAQERVALDFYPKHNLRSMIEDGYITSNAKRLLPKNVDVYIEHWNGNDFAPTEMQKQELERGNVDEQYVDNSPEPPTGLFRRSEAEEYDETREQFVFPADEVADEIEPEAPEIGVTNHWKALTDEQRAGLESYYDMTEKDFNEASPEDRENLLACIGV